LRIRECNMEANTAFKIVLLGDAAVGKSSLLQKFTTGDFDDESQATIGAAFIPSNILLDDNISVRLNIWDTAGQERFATIAKMYYRDAKAALVVYDITKPDSLVRAKNWVEELRESGTDYVIALCGNKLDLAEKRQVSFEEVSQYATAEKLVFREMSAKNGLNVTEVFHDVAKLLHEKTNSTSGNEESGTIVLESEKQKNKQPDIFKECDLFKIFKF